ncbi:DUF1360 domain-containing protein [Actinopolymorpha rutila]|uniref:DUF1360 domain-containing protein n=1 Tax=Actinopolymorpha rutila TaxID=446787 RepID=A0A852ZV92_9ACTN|nr:DUF1360 domain-containing protein [Actinopolymorpha rutila]NYH93239.1 hypothetical protein [Actinopolymorpha rutila]
MNIDATTMLGRLADEQDTYEHGHDQPLRGYLAAMAVFAGGTGAMSVLARATGRRLPDRVALTDVILGGVATHKFARLLAKDAVTSPVRVPFTQFEDAAGSAELNESARKDGELRHGIGELVSCPFCLAPWIATGYVAALTFAPRVARAWSSVLTTVAISDVLQHVYARIRTE